MKHFLLVITSVLFVITTTFSQGNQNSAIDSLATSKEFQNTKTNIESVDLIINNWQLLSHEVYDNYPDDKTGETDFVKGKEFLNLEKNGKYASILNNNFNQGFWLQNNNLVVFKQKVPTTVDVYYEVVNKSNTELILKNGNEHHQHGQCNPLGQISQYNVDAVLTSGMGKRAVQKLNYGGVKVFLVNGKTVEEALQNFEEKELAELTMDSACGGHGHGFH